MTDATPDAPAAPTTKTPLAPLLQIKDFFVTFDTNDGKVEAVRGVNLEIAPGECLGVVGESGSGKSQTFLAAFGLLPQNGRAAGSVRFANQEILGLPRRELNKLRGRKVSMVFQDPLTSLTPHMRIGDQMAEVLHHHFPAESQPQKKCLDWLERVRIPEAARRLQQYPHELSGGMRQRVMLAMAMMTDPELLIADEPTTALDATVQAQVLDLMRDLIAETKTAVALITHDMGVIAQMAERVAVMRKGEIVEQDTVDAVFMSPRESYTRALLEAVPKVTGGARHTAAESLGPAPGDDVAPLLQARDLKVYFNVPGEGLFARPRKLRAVDGVDLDLRPGETLGVVGESGCGKSTLARGVMQLVPTTAGSVTFLAQALTDADRAAIREARKDLQIVFQDPLASLDPRMTVGSSIAEPLLAFEPGLDRAGREDRVREMMALVGLDPTLINRYPHELSGGQNQRVGIARAMIMKPKLVVCDEAVSALDVSIQAQIVRLLIRLQKQFGLAMLFISHDLAVVREVSHRIMVLYLGRVVETGPTDALFADPRHPYTKALLSAAPVPDPKAARERPRIRLIGDLPSPLDPKAGLRFLKSKISSDPNVEQYRPKLLEVGPAHWVAEFDEEAAVAA
jgi:peptide/nickel transport system ATP-binding protein/oligopeptide transport system ATP-binding protein